ncbi:TPA: hypothetical protein DCP77_03665 [Candidatus Collierbacteria bacterium]|nr:hypothetical protein [Candidatus Collierbacteria bacterium]HAN22847.1 hypothetical protein [Candidatus Collierbacteria bacterium]HBX63999.1 hypothetical protein [Candidatus Collierbacteria bacterium]
MVILRLNEMSTPIKKLTELLSGRLFDFKYKLAKDGGLSTVFDQKLNQSLLSPVRLEIRGEKDHRKEYLVFVVEGTDDLLVSVSDWKGILDIEIKDDKEILITNYEGDWYLINIHSGK